jgi:hypothetical protein
VILLSRVSVFFLCQVFFCVTQWFFVVQKHFFVVQNLFLFRTCFVQKLVSLFRSCFCSEAFFVQKLYSSEAVFFRSFFFVVQKLYSSAAFFVVQKLFRSCSEAVQTHTLFRSSSEAFFVVQKHMLFLCSEISEALFRSSFQKHISAAPFRIDCFSILSSSCASGSVVLLILSLFVLDVTEIFSCSPGFLYHDMATVSVHDFLLHLSYSPMALIFVLCFCP